MRLVIAVLIAIGFIAASGVEMPSFVPDGTSVVAAQAPSGQLEIDIDTDGDGAWWTSPLWIGIGIVALIAVIALIVAAMRGGGTTVVKG
jgi:hypothetical protein